MIARFPIGSTTSFTPSAVLVGSAAGSSNQNQNSVAL